LGESPEKERGGGGGEGRKISSLPLSTENLVLGLSLLPNHGNVCYAGYLMFQAYVSTQRVLSHQG